MSLAGPESQPFNVCMPTLGGRAERSGGIRPGGVGGAALVAFGIGGGDRGTGWGEEEREGGMKPIGFYPQISAIGSTTLWPMGEAGREAPAPLAPVHLVNVPSPQASS